VPRTLPAEESSPTKPWEGRLTAARGSSASS
jgi:hypothetical protein